MIASAPDAVLAHVAGVAWHQRLGNGHHTMSPHDVYPCGSGNEHGGNAPGTGAGGWLALAVGDEGQWTALCTVLGRDDWALTLPTPAARRNAIDQIDDAIRAWTGPRTAAEAAAILQAAGVPAEPVLSFADLAADPHLAARQAFVDVEHPVLGRQRVLRPPWRFSAGGRGGSGGGPVRPGPVLGADTDAILAPFTKGVENAGDTKDAGIRKRRGMRRPRRKGTERRSGDGCGAPAGEGRSCRRR
ncbi:CoA transferase [Frankia sp. R82]|uniref:CoA transferase n=1 Tax=Frankia sp. R82 TaxID=2950553 RepID=UPI002044C67B|nr:CoA transferase [Frankia sp. R82]MCM3884208.1 CoA transferase [Frankia sp. R82]